MVSQEAGLQASWTFVVTSRGVLGHALQKRRAATHLFNTVYPQSQHNDVVAT